MQPKRKDDSPSTLKIQIPLYLPFKEREKHPTHQGTAKMSFWDQLLSAPVMPSSLTTMETVALDDSMGDCKYLLMNTCPH
jgi:hypothetical protein